MGNCIKIVQGMTMKYLLLLLISFSCLADDTLPDPTLTPGMTVPGCTKEKFDKPNQTGAVRKGLTKAVHDSAYTRYNLKPREGKCSGPEGCEVDHLISLVLCGSNDVENLWPQSYAGTCNAHHKDTLEVRLHILVKSGKLDLGQAQREISSNWIEAYKKYVNAAGCGIVK